MPLYISNVYIVFFEIMIFFSVESKHDKLIKNNVCEELAWFFLISSLKNKTTDESSLHCLKPYDKYHKTDNFFMTMALLD